MNIINFINQYTHQYQPIQLHIEKKDNKIKKVFPRQVAKSNDNKHLGENIFRERQEHIERSRHLAIHLSCNICVLDVDWADDYKPSENSTKFINDMKKNFPYKTSTTKKQGLHIYFQPSPELYQSTLKYKARHPEFPFPHMEILTSGSWVFEETNSLIHNEGKGLAILKKFPRNPIDKKKKKLILSINPLEVSIKDKWVKVLSSIKSLGEEYYEVADELSRKTIYNNYGDVRATWINITPTPFSYIEELAKKVERNKKCEIDTITSSIHDLIKNDIVIHNRDGKLIMYIYTNNRWVQDGQSNRYLKMRITNLFEKYLKDDYEDEYNNITTEFKELTNLSNLVLNKLIMNYVENIEFDNYDHLYHFSNITLDLKEMKFRKRKKEDYSTFFGCKLDDLELDDEGNLVWNNKIIKSVEKWETIFNDIFTNEDVKKTYIEILCNSFSGKVLPKFIVSNGAGSNGKSFLHACMMSLHNDYSYKGNTSTLTTPLNGGASPSIANHHRKRFSLFSEPDEDEKMLFSTIKSMTGDRSINARALYTNNTNTIMAGIKICECNARLPLQGITDYSMTRRLIDILFKTCFKSKEELKDHVEDDVITYKTANLEYITESWREENKSGLFYFLFKYMIDNRKNYDNLENIYIADSVKLRSSNYITQQNKLLEIVNTFCIEDINSCLTMNELADAIKQNPDVYNLLTKKEKKDLTSKALTIRMSKDPQLQNKFVAGRKTKNKITYNNALFGYKLIKKPIICDEF